MSGFRVAIPARYASSRLPGKPILLLDERPIIEHVYRRAIESGADDVLIATDDARIATVARGFGARVQMTRGDHRSGTDRLAEAVAAAGWPDDAIVVNLQGDEPFMPAPVLCQVARNLLERPLAGMATLCTPIVDRDEIDNTNAVKVVFDNEGWALYFSRATIPHWRDRTAAEADPSASMYYRHLGLYAYRADVLRRYPMLEPAPYEIAESLEQLRALWHGIRIHVDVCADPLPPGIDTMGDLERARASFLE